MTFESLIAFQQISGSRNAVKLGKNIWVIDPDNSRSRSGETRCAHVSSEASRVPCRSTTINLIEQEWRYSAKRRTRISTPPYIVPEFEYMQIMCARGLNSIESFWREESTGIRLFSADQIAGGGGYTVFRCLIASFRRKGFDQTDRDQSILERSLAAITGGRGVRGHTDQSNDS